MTRLVTRLAALAAMADRLARRLDWLPPLVARLTVGVVFLQSGWGKLHDLASVTDFFTELGIPMPAFQAELASTTEFVCGGLLLLGLATRAAAVPLVVVMAVAIRTALWDQVDGLASLLHLTEFAYVALLVGLAVRGGGVVSLDALVGSALSRAEVGAAPASATAPVRG
jgi:putative oxidoreductase